jgi:hypothetical protein
MKRTGLKRPTLEQVRAWQNRPKKPIKKVSTKHKSKLNIYYKQREAFMRRQIFCTIPNCINPATDVHHVKGRGPFLLDESTWRAVCRGCHISIHANVARSIELGYIIPR